MGTHPIFESDFDCLTGMIFEIVCATSVIGISVLIGLIIQYPRQPDNDQMESEFVTGGSVPSFVSEAEIDLSVIIPAYNEIDRLPGMLDECVECLKTAKKQTWEVIVVDDGSIDGTYKIPLELSKNEPRVKCLKLLKNRGKGHAVKMGMMAARGRKIFFADADRAMPFTEFQKINEKFEYLHDKYPDLLVIGSRAHLEKESIAQRSLFRTILMKGFHLCVWLFCVQSVRDTQCGYKLFSRTAAQKILPNLHIQRWAFDVELLYIAEIYKMKISEVGIKWEEIEGTKMVPILSWIQMARDLVMIWIRYTTKYWRVQKTL